MTGFMRRCRVCGCTDMRGCPEGCYWVEEDLCSECDGADEPEQGPEFLMGFPINYADIEEVIGDDEEEDDDCPVCRCVLEWTECGYCGGEGAYDGYEEDPLWYDPGEMVRCPECGGKGGWLECPSAEFHHEVLEERAYEKGGFYYAWWKGSDWVKSRGRRMIDVIRWKLLKRGRLLRANWELFRLRVQGRGWGVVLFPIERCSYCGQICRVLWWYRGDHTHLPF